MIATVVSQYISAVYIVAYLAKMSGAYRLSLGDLKIYKREIFAILKIGLPAGIQNSLFSISNVIIQSSVNSFGSSAMAGIAAGSNYDGYIYVCTNAVAQTTMTFSSQNLGAGKYENIEKIYRRCLTLAAIIAVVLSGVGYFLREQIVGIFSSESEVIKIGAQRIALVLPFYVFCSLQDVVAGQLRGLGRSTEPMFVSLFGTCGVRLLWIFFALPYDPTLINLYWAYPISWTATFIVLAVMYIFVKRSVVKKAVLKDDA